MHSTNLSVKTHLISASPSAVTKLIQSANEANIQSDGLILEPLASAHSVINENEKNDGVLMVDIGGGTTDLMFFKNKRVEYTAVIPVGGFHFTNDIASTYQIDSREAEYIKIKYGSAAINIKNNFVKEIEMKSKLSPEPIKVSHTELIRLTRERAEELVKLINIKIKPIDFKNNPKYKIVITGGTSNLNGLSELIARNITSNVRIGSPKIGLNNLVKFKNIPDELKNPRFSTVLGMVLWAIGGILNETSDSSFEPGKIQKNDPYSYSFSTQKRFLMNILKKYYNNIKKISQQIINNIIKGDQQ